MAEHAEHLKKTKVGVAVGTPGRVSDLLNDSGSSTSIISAHSLYQFGFGLVSVLRSSRPTFGIFAIVFVRDGENAEAQTYHLFIFFGWFPGPSASSRSPFFLLSCSRNEVLSLAHTVWDSIALIPDLGSFERGCSRRRLAFLCNLHPGTLALPPLPSFVVLRWFGLSLLSFRSFRLGSFYFSFRIAKHRR